MGQFSPTEYFQLKLMPFFFVKSYAILHTKFIEQNLC